VGQLTSLIAGKLIAFDTGPLIYYIEEHPDYLSRADELFSALDGGAALGMTSVLTLQEVLVKPLREGQDDLAAKYRQVLTRLRAKYAWLRTPDALQIATAIRHGAEIIVTNDDGWRRVSEIVVFVLQDFAKA
jgi:predicted nucleic acid-binding protein